MSMSGCAAFEMALKCIVHLLLFVLAELLFLSCFFHMSVLRHKLINNSYLKLKRVTYSVKSTHANICLPPIRLYSSHRNATCLHLRPYVFRLSVSLSSPSTQLRDFLPAASAHHLHPPLRWRNSNRSETGPLSVYRTTLGGSAVGYTGIAKYFTMLSMFLSLQWSVCIACVCLRACVFLSLSSSQRLRTHVLPVCVSRPKQSNATGLLGAPEAAESALGEHGDTRRRAYLITYTGVERTQMSL